MTNRKVETFAFIIVIFLVIGIGHMIMNSISEWFDDNCYKEQAVLHNQYVGDLEGCCENCLVFNVTEFVCYGQPGDGCGCEWKDKMLYFSEEQQKRTDLKNGSEIWVNWCLNPNTDEYFINGVSKVQSNNETVITEKGVDCD